MREARGHRHGWGGGWTPASEAAENVPLGMCAEGSKCRVCHIDGGTCLRKRLRDMGLVIGNVIGVLKSCGGGPVVIATGDGRMAIGRGASMRILVEPEGNGSV